MDEKNGWKFLGLGGAVVVLVALLLAWVATKGLENTINTSAQSASESNTQIQTAVVARVIDGDTIELTDKRRVRYLGIDTPEVASPGKTAQCYSGEATRENQQLVEGKTVRLEIDSTNRDKYGRLLRYVYVQDNSGREIFVNDYLLRGGFARSLIIAPDLRLKDQFNDAVAEAKFQERGLWSVCF